MPFGLKNAGETYQRLINEMFKNQIRRNVEVYIDNMLVKSLLTEQHLSDLSKMFQTLGKRAFRVFTGKFLGFMIFQQGIEANPEKVKAIIEMQPSKNTKEVHRLVGQFTVLKHIHISGY